jgi:hypothetical protein
MNQFMNPRQQLSSTSCHIMPQDEMKHKLLFMAAIMAQDVVEK